MENLHTSIRNVLNNLGDDDRLDASDGSAADVAAAFWDYVSEDDADGDGEAGDKVFQYYYASETDLANALETAMTNDDSISASEFLADVFNGDKRTHTPDDTSDAAEVEPEEEVEPVDEVEPRGEDTETSSISGTTSDGPVATDGSATLDELWDGYESHGIDQIIHIINVRRDTSDPIRANVEAIESAISNGGMTKEKLSQMIAILKSIYEINISSDINPATVTDGEEDGGIYTYTTDDGAKLVHNDGTDYNYIPAPAE